MVVNIEYNLVRLVVLDLSGAYVQIYDQGYFDRNKVKDIKQQYSDTEHWRVIVLD